jgi:arylformamidase
MGNLIDVSMDVFTGMTVWPGDEGVVLERTDSLEQGAAANVSRLRCSVHTGTHVDAPLHFIAGGRGIDRLPLEILCGPAWTAEFPGVDTISADHLDGAGIPADIRRLLVKTSNSESDAARDPFRERFAGIGAGAAEWILRRGVRLLGVDYLSVSAGDRIIPVHRMLLQSETVIVEGLRLAEAPPGPCRFYCLPLKLIGADGAPARAMVEVDG